MNCVEQMINEHNAKVKSVIIECSCSQCPKCHECCNGFKRHDIYERRVCFIMDGFIKTVIVWLKRWKCPLCKRTFVDYPCFLLPYKHYTVADIQELSLRYLSYDEQTYRSAVTDEGLTIGYSENDGEINEQQLVPSTLWRWLSSIAKLCFATAQTATFSLVIPASKYRSKERKQVLQQARAALEPDKKLNSVIFPYFATGQAVT